MGADIFPSLAVLEDRYSKPSYPSVTRFARLKSWDAQVTATLLFCPSSISGIRSTHAQKGHCVLRRAVGLFKPCSRVSSRVSTSFYSV